MEMVEMIQANAQLVRQVARSDMDVQLEYDQAGVRWLNGYIDRQRNGGNPAIRKILVNTLGSYLGECIRITYGGEWISDPQLGWGVRLPGGVTAFPFNKVGKQLEEDSNSVLSFFTAIPALMQLPPSQN